MWMFFRLGYGEPQCMKKKGRSRDAVCVRGEAKNAVSGGWRRDSSRISRKQRTVAQMVRLYCRHAEGNEELCPSCHELLDYAVLRLSRCPHGERKPYCQHCPIHCYRPEMRERMRRVMRYAGPRMLWHHPVAALRHLLRL